ncbi:DUF4255 domain-containing protein [Haladaptatus sp. NG-SE-30]
MRTDSAIADVGLTLVELLQSQMGNLSGEEIALASPATSGDGNDLRLTLYLYRITETADLKNARKLSVDPTNVNVAQSRNPPLALDLYYLLTAHPTTGGTNETERTSEQHAVLGRAMQVLHDNTVLRGSELSGDLAGDPEQEVRITITSTDQQSLDGMMNLWSTFPDQPFQPSLSYLVSPILIESTKVDDAPRVIEKEERYYDDLGDT